MNATKLFHVTLKDTDQASRDAALARLEAAGVSRDNVDFLDFGEGRQVMMGWRKRHPGESD